LKYERKIESLRSKEALITYNASIEEIALTVVQHYFDAYVLNKTIESNRKALNDTREIYEIAQKRFNIGSINKGDLLTLELAILDAELSISDEISMQRDYLNRLKELTSSNIKLIKLQNPNIELLNIDIEYEKAISKLLSNNAMLIKLEREKKEKELEIGKYKSSNKLSLGINASFGLSNTGSDFSSATSDLMDQQSYSLSVRYLIMDFGKNKQQIKIMNSEKELLQNEYDIEVTRIKNDLFKFVNEFDLLKRRLMSLNRKNSLSDERFEYLKKRFALGKVTINDLNLAQKEKGQINVEYLRTIKDLWVTYYKIRQLTLFDFIENKNISYL